MPPLPAAMYCRVVHGEIGCLIEAVDQWEKGFGSMLASNEPACRLTHRKQINRDSQDFCADVAT
jgi:hypothetical protein